MISIRHVATLALCLLPVLPVTAQNLVQNPGFESGTTGWWDYGPVSFSASPVASHSGTNGVLVTNRTEWWQGVAQTIFGVMQPEVMYRMSVWVKLPPGSTPQLMQLAVVKGDAGGETSETAADGMVTTNWTKLSGGYTLRVNGTLIGLTMALRGAAPGTDFYADDFTMEVVDWKAAANARIEQLRKRDFRLLVTDATGNPVPGASLQINQTRHQFGFGSAINFHITNTTYAEFFRTNFEWAVIEDETKWQLNEPNLGEVTYSVADGIVEFCRTNAIPLRGHCLFYWAPQWFPGLSNHVALSHLSNRIESVVNHFKGTFRHWDVNNESLRGDYYAGRFGDGINTWMYQHAAAQDPAVKLFPNETDTFEGSGTEAYKQQIQTLIASNAPVGGIGVQGHLFYSRPCPLLLEARLTSLGELGLPIWISEYDSISHDENIRAENLESMYRTAYSHPAVEGVMMWGFWAGAKWLGSDAAIVNSNWSFNAAGIRYRSLMTEWTTVTNKLTDASGACFVRGFQGDYDVTITPPGGLPTLRRFTHASGPGTNLVTLISHNGGSRPLLHHAGRNPTNGGFFFQLTGDAGRTYAIEQSSNVITWTGLTNLPNLTGTVSFTNTGSASARLYYRARRVP